MYVGAGTYTCTAITHVCSLDMLAHVFYLLYIHHTCKITYMHSTKNHIQQTLQPNILNTIHYTNNRMLIQHTVLTMYYNIDNTRKSALMLHIFAIIMLHHAVILRHAATVVRTGTHIMQHIVRYVLHIAILQRHTTHIHILITHIEIQSVFI